MDPLTGKLRFKLRTLTNWGIIVSIFIPLTFIFAQFQWAWIAQLVTIILLFYLYFFVLDKRAIGISCPHCDHYIGTNTPWVCGYCKVKVEKIDEFPFVHQCEHCGAEPKAYKCHHTKCGKLIFLTKDTLEQNYATCLNFSEKSLEAVTDAGRYEKEKQEIEHKLAMSELNGKLEAAEQRREMAKRKTPSEEIEASFTKYFSKVMGSEEFALKRKAINAEEYKDNPEKRKKADEVVDSWLRSRV